MKKIIILAVLFVTLTSCAKSHDASMPKTDVPYISTTESTEKKGFGLVFTSYRQGNTVLYYPQIEGFESMVQQDKLNKMIFEDAKKAIALFDDDFACITVDYEVVKKSDEEIVIEYTGHGYTSSETDAEEIVEYTSTISLVD